MIPKAKQKKKKLWQQIAQTSVSHIKSQKTWKENIAAKNATFKSHKKKVSVYSYVTAICASNHANT